MQNIISVNCIYTKPFLLVDFYFHDYVYNDAHARAKFVMNDVRAVAAYIHGHMNAQSATDWSIEWINQSTTQAICQATA